MWFKKLLSKKTGERLPILLIILFGGFFRFYNLNWDEGHFFHPDERNIAAAVSRIHFFSQINPKFFAYGSLPIYFYRFLSELATRVTHDHRWVYDWAYINLVGRSVSALLASLSLLLIFVFAQKIWDEKTALLAAFFLAFSPALIQTAHYGVTESVLVFWLLLILIFSFELVQKPNLKNYLKTGTVLGLAITTKISAVSFAIIPTVAHFFCHFKYLKRHLLLAVFLLTAFLTFAFFSPYVFLDKKAFLGSMHYETGVSTGSLRVCYTLQFEKTRPYLFQIKNFFWQMGPAALLGMIGLITLLVVSIKNKDKKVLILLSFPLVYFGYVGSWHTKFVRYMVPVLPFLALAAGWLLNQIFQKQKRAGIFLIPLTCLATFFWALAFFSIYTRESTRITASKWIYENIPAGSKILGEHWDDGLPIHLDNLTPTRFRYEIEQLTIYEPDNAAKVNYLAEKLSMADYIILNSRRLYGTLLYLPEKYPITSRYYHLLFADQLGYQKVAEFTSYPSIFGIEINDDSSEESFQVYDHPKVMIFKNQQGFSEKNLKNILY